MNQRVLYNNFCTESGAQVSKDLYSLLSCKRVLLLQGPMGNFFNRFAKWLNKNNISVKKINFNGGDWFFHHHLDAVNYRDTLENFPKFLSLFIKSNQIDAVVCFGDCRHYHRLAKKVCSEKKIKFFAFEEGYIRPNYITFEKDGVNKNSNLPQDPNFYRFMPNPVVTPPHSAKNSFKKTAFVAMTYYFMGSMCWPVFSHYQHHRKFGVWYEGTNWIRSFVRKYLNKSRDLPVFEKLITAHHKRYFVAVLQVYNDSQIVFHSDYEDVRDYIEDVISSFAYNAHRNDYLVFKHHPMDRGVRDYRKLITSLARQFNIEERICYLHDVHLPTLLKHARGVVTVNSTVGLSSLYHDIPLKVMGRAFYDMPGLSYQGELNRFWRKQNKIDRELWKKFRAYLIKNTQLNGAYYGIDFFDLLSTEVNETQQSEDDIIATSVKQAA